MSLSLLKKDSSALFITMFDIIWAIPDFTVDSKRFFYTIDGITHLHQSAYAPIYLQLANPLVV